ncbi:MAG TPA: 2'-5' RNA ligase family protein [Candidatus Limnocylindrales bacterium]|nr:2'-5' RNA ligase family protein [Candidatus Limnocylindrales bacterium]
MDQPGGRTAIVVPFDLPPALEAIRRAHVDNAHLGIPAHVTLLFPFVRADRLVPADVDRAAAVLRGTAAFDVAFREARTFEPGPTEEGVVWLAPEPDGPFLHLTNGLAAAFPGYLPYEGLHDTVIAHLTLADTGVDVAALVAAARPELPFERRVEAAAVLIEDDAGGWRVAHELPLG